MSFEPQLISPIVKYVAAKIIRGSFVKGYTFAQFAQGASERFGNEIKPYLQKIWNEANALVEPALSASKKGFRGHAMNSTVMPTTPAIDVGDDDLYEIIDGERRGTPPMGIFAVWIANEISFYLTTFAKANKVGRSVVEALFHLPTPINRDRRPDVAFVSYDRWPKNRPIPPTANAWDVVPNVVTEVVSPSDIADEIEAKTAEYFRAGVQLVWVVYPTYRKIYVHRSPTDVRLLTIADILDGGDVLPGFRLSLTELFGDESDGQA